MRAAKRRRRDGPASASSGQPQLPFAALEAPFEVDAGARAVARTARLLAGGRRDDASWGLAECGTPGAGGDAGHVHAAVFEAVFFEPSWLCGVRAWCGGGGGSGGGGGKKPRPSLEDRVNEYAAWVFLSGEEAVENRLLPHCLHAVCAVLAAASSAAAAAAADVEGQEEEKDTAGASSGGPLLPSLLASKRRWQQLTPGFVAEQRQEAVRVASQGLPVFASAVAAQVSAAAAAAASSAASAQRVRAALFVLEAMQGSAGADAGKGFSDAVGSAVDVLSRLGCVGRGGGGGDGDVSAGLSADIALCDAAAASRGLRGGLLARPSPSPQLSADGRQVEVGWGVCIKRAAATGAAEASSESAAATYAPAVAASLAAVVARRVEKTVHEGGCGGDGGGAAAVRLARVLETQPAAAVGLWRHVVRTLLEATAAEDTEGVEGAATLFAAFFAAASQEAGPCAVTLRGRAPLVLPASDAALVACLAASVHARCADAEGGQRRAAACVGAFACHALGGRAPDAASAHAAAQRQAARRRAGGGVRASDLFAALAARVKEGGGCDATAAEARRAIKERLPCQTLTELMNAATADRVAEDEALRMGLVGRFCGGDDGDGVGFVGDLLASVTRRGSGEDNSHLVMMPCVTEVLRLLQPLLLGQRGGHTTAFDALAQRVCASTVDAGVLHAVLSVEASPARAAAHAAAAAAAPAPQAEGSDRGGADGVVPQAHLRALVSDCVVSRLWHAMYSTEVVDGGGGDEEDCGVSARLRCFVGGSSARNAQGVLAWCWDAFEWEGEEEEEERGCKKRTLAMLRDVARCLDACRWWLADVVDAEALGELCRARGVVRAAESGRTCLAWARRYCEQYVAHDRRDAVRSYRAATGYELFKARDTLDAPAWKAAKKARAKALKKAGVVLAPKQDAPSPFSVVVDLLLQGLGSRMRCVPPPLRQQQQQQQQPGDDVATWFSWEPATCPAEAAYEAEYFAPLFPLYAPRRAAAAEAAAATAEQTGEEEEEEEGGAVMAAYKYLLLCQAFCFMCPFLDAQEVKAVLTGVVSPALEALAGGGSGEEEETEIGEGAQRHELLPAFVARCVLLVANSGVFAVLFRAETLLELSVFPEHFPEAFRSAVVAKAQLCAAAVLAPLSRTLASLRLRAPDADADADADAGADNTILVGPDALLACFTQTVSALLTEVCICLLLLSCVVCAWIASSTPPPPPQPSEPLSLVVQTLFAHVQQQAAAAGETALTPLALRYDSSPSHNATYTNHRIPFTDASARQPAR